MLRPPPLRLCVRIVPKLNLTLGLVRPLIRVIVRRLGERGAVCTRGPDRRRIPHLASYILPHLAQRSLHRRSHLLIPFLLLRSVWDMEYTLVQPG